jgi:uncharacterized hydrophobic protein (TIGR00271 family)
MSATGPQTDYKLARRFRNWLAGSLGLGLGPDARTEIYIEMSQAASIKDPMHWLQIFCAAGIATLGLVLNSPAVIIGAMLISPLMAPILSGGLALSAGDIVLAVRAVVNILLSCAISIGIAALLIWLLPFKEVTAEISARTQPNTLDLVIALFSGGIGSVSICKQTRGLMTSIPGVAIAVALMPPLCVTGFGVGVAMSASGGEGWRIAGGGALLFLTNLIAITFTALLVFAALQLNSVEVRRRVRLWRQKDEESTRVRQILLALPVIRKFRWLQSLPARIALSFAGLVLLAIPLSRSFFQLKNEIARKHQENELLHEATHICDETVPGTTGPRCYVGRLDLVEQGERLAVNLRVFTRKPYSEAEKNAYVERVAALLHRPVSSIALGLVEIPTTSGDLVAEQAKQQRNPAPVVTFSQMEADFLAATHASMGHVQLPPPADFINYTVSASDDRPLRITIAYLSARPISEDAQSLLASEIQAKLGDSKAVLEFKMVPSGLGSITLTSARRAQLSSRHKEMLDAAGQALAEYPSLNLRVREELGRKEREDALQAWNAAALSYLQSKWRISSERVEVSTMPGKKLSTAIAMGLARPEAAAGGQ